MDGIKVDLKYYISKFKNYMEITNGQAYMDLIKLILQDKNGVKDYLDLEVRITLTKMIE